MCVGERVKWDNALKHVMLNIFNLIFMKFDIKKSFKVLCFEKTIIKTLKMSANATFR